MRMFTKLKRTLACTLAMVVLTASLTACGGGGGGGGSTSSGSGSTSTGSSTSTDSSSSSASSSITDVSSSSDANMGSGLSTSRTKAFAEKYSSGVVTYDADAVSVLYEADAVLKFHTLFTSNGSDSYTYVKGTETVQSETSDYEFALWIKNGKVYEYDSDFSAALNSDEKIIIEIPQDVVENPYEISNAFYLDNILGSITPLGMQSAPSSFTDEKTYYAEQFYTTYDGDNLQITYYFDNDTLVYGSVYDITTGDKTDTRYNSISPTFDSSKMTVGGNGYRIITDEELYEEMYLKELTQFIDPDNPTDHDSLFKSLYYEDFEEEISYLRSIENPSEETTRWLEYWDSL